MTDLNFMMFFCMVLFCLYFHPLPMVIFLTLQAVPLMLSYYYFSMNMWLMYMLVLIYLGGLLIIFIYLSALIPNDSLTKNTVVFFVILLSTLLMKTLNSNSFEWNNLNMVFYTSSVFSNNLLLFIMLYLLVGLFSILYLIMKKKTPLKSNTYDLTKKDPFN